jgi:hypothetical protein
MENTLAPLALSDLEISTIMQVSRPLDPEARSRSIEIVASKLGEGTVWRVCAETQRQLFRPPDVGPTGKYHR